MCYFRVIPTVLGTKPKPFRGHLAMLYCEDRILVVKESSTFDECIWFLEVGIRISETPAKVSFASFRFFSTGCIFLL